MATTTRTPLTSRTSLTSLAALTIFLGACERSRDPVTAPARPPMAAAFTQAKGVVGSKYPRPDEDRFVTMGREASSFAGFYIDTVSGAIVVQVADTAHFGILRAAMAHHLADASFGFPRQYRSRPVVIHKVAYTFQQLSDWRDAVSDSILGKYGTEMVDLDEARNTVTISVPTAQQPALRQALSALGIPANAVFLREAKGIRTSSPRRASARLRHR